MVVGDGVEVCVLIAGGEDVGAAGVDLLGRGDCGVIVVAGVGGDG